MYFYTSNKKRASNEILQYYKTKYLEALSSTENIVLIDDSEIKNKYKLTSQAANKYSLQGKEESLLQLVTNLAENNMLSPDNSNEIIATATRLQLNPNTSPVVFTQINKLKRYWEIILGKLPLLRVSINLQKNEVCYYEGYCKWHENRTSTKSVSYSGVSSSIRIAKGVRYTIGSYTPHRITETHLVHIDSGKLFVTNKRIIFMGGKKNTNIRFSSILSITPYSDSVGIEKSSGKSPIISCTDPDILARFLLRAIYIGSDDTNADDIIESLPSSNKEDEKIIELIINNRKLDAVKLLHDERGMTLKQAKDYVDSLA